MPAAAASDAAWHQAADSAAARAGPSTGMPNATRRTAPWPAQLRAASVAVTTPAPTIDATITR